MSYAGAHSESFPAYCFGQKLTWIKYAFIDRPSLYALLNIFYRIVEVKAPNRRLPHALIKTYMVIKTQSLKTDWKFLSRKMKLNKPFLCWTVMCSPSPLLGHRTSGRSSTEWPPCTEHVTVCSYWVIFWFFHQDLHKNDKNTISSRWLWCWETVSPSRKWRGQSCWGQCQWGPQRTDTARDICMGVLLQSQNIWG